MQKDHLVGGDGGGVRVDKTVEVEAFTIYGAMRKPGLGALDPITVMLRDLGGQGQIIVECYGAAWAQWFGAIGSSTLREFVSVCDEYYLAGKLVSQNARRATKREEVYVQDIARAIISALKSGAA